MKIRNCEKILFKFLKRSNIKNKTQATLKEVKAYKALQKHKPYKSIFYLIHLTNGNRLTIWTGG